MDLGQELIRIDKLGFTTTLSWGNYIQVSHHLDTLDINESIDGETFIMAYFYEQNELYTFDQAAVEVINVFNSWYYNYTLTGDLKGIDNINNMVNRSLKIDEIIKD